MCYELHDENKKQELDGIVEAMNFFKLKEGLILTFNQKDNLVIDGKQINLVPVFEFIQIQ